MAPKEDLEPRAVLLRIPPAMLDQLDAYAAKRAPNKFQKVSRNAVILAMIERSLKDEGRSR